MSNIRNWGTYQVDSIAADDASVQRGGSSVLSLKEGRNELRFLPPPLGKSSIFAIVHQHYINLPGMKETISFNCPQAMGFGSCPVCTKANALRSTGHAPDYDLARELSPGLRVYANVIDRDAADKGPQTLGFGKKIYTALTAFRQDPVAGGDFSDPISGYDVVIKRSGKGKNDTQYEVLLARSMSRLAPDDDGIALWVDAAPDLAKFATILPVEEIQRRLGMGGFSGAIGDVNVALPPRGRGVTSSLR